MSESTIPTDVPFERVAGRLNAEGFGDVTGTGWYRDAVYEGYSEGEYARRLQVTRDKMAREGLDVLLAAGGPNHWSFGAGMSWLSGYWEWHGASAYVVVPREGPCVLVAGPGGAHREAIRRLSAIAEVRHSRRGRSGQVIVDLLRERGLDTGRVGLTFVDPVYGHYPPFNEVEALRAGLGDRLEFVGDFFHEFFYAKSEEEADAVRVAGRLLDRALHAMIAAVRPGVTEQELAAAATAPILDGGGRVNFAIVGSTPMDDPALAFGNPWPSQRPIREGDIILNELACGYRGFTVQLGSPICVGPPPAWIHDFFYEVVRPGFDAMAAQLQPGNTWEQVRKAGQAFGEAGYDGRPLLLHTMDRVTHKPHVNWHDVAADEADQVIRPGVAAMLEPTVITPDGKLGIFFGRSFLITEDGHEQVTRFPHELIVI
ncbi:MAG TPA: M24 family metallopeptidase [Egicoccus sp.]|nr:M24 family metallopeptidase [Egicoccus sp.]HSK23023.1 M24 family metallopeptidase [Egicoccus sp.]